MMPLAGKRIVVTRREEQAEEIIAQLEAQGATVILFPTIRLVMLDSAESELTRAFAEIGRYHWVIFTSQNTVQNTLGHPLAVSTLQNSQTKLAASGTATRERLERAGLRVAITPERFIGEALIESLGDLNGKRVLLPRALQGRPEIVDLLEEGGAIVDEIPLYNTISAEPPAHVLAQIAQGVDCISFTSPSTVHAFMKVMKEPPYWKKVQSAVIAVIGPITAEALPPYRLTPQIIAAEHSANGLVSAIIHHYQRGKQ